MASAHPRAFGAFPRVLAKYVREEGVIPLEEAIRKLTSLPAGILRLGDRGRIAPGMAADLGGQAGNGNHDGQDAGIGRDGAEQFSAHDHASLERSRRLVLRPVPPREGAIGRGTTLRQP